MQDQVNPFSTRFIKPGAISFQQPNSDGLQIILRQLETQEWTGEIVGPHGSGKSTLVESLKTMIEKKIHHFVIHSQDNFESKFNSILRWLQADQHNDTLLIIDGLEQLTSPQQNQIIQQCKQQGLGLIVTSHQSVGLPLVHECKTPIDSFRVVVQQLVGERSIQITDKEIEYAFDKYNPNLREALFSLYDVYEVKRRKNR